MMTPAADTSLRRLELQIAVWNTATYYVCKLLGRPWRQDADPNPFPIMRLRKS